jgi:hypothetical protein
MHSGEETNTNFIAFSLTRQGFEPMIYHTQTSALPMRCLTIWKNWLSIWNWKERNFNLPAILCKTFTLIVDLWFLIFICKGTNSCFVLFNVHTWKVRYSCSGGSNPALWPNQVKVALINCNSAINAIRCIPILATSYIDCCAPLDAASINFFSFLKGNSVF